MNKILAIVLIAAIMVSSLIGTVCAESSVYQGNTDIKDAYTEYLEENKDLPLAKSKFYFETVTTSGEAVLQLNNIENKDALSWNGFGEITFEVDIDESALYNLLIDYYVVETGTTDVSIDILFDGADPFDGLTNISLPRLFSDDGSIRTDGVGNEFAPEQKQVFKWNSIRVTDSEGLNREPYLFAVEKGRHKVTLCNASEPIAISSLGFIEKETPNSYKQLLEDYKQKGYVEYSGKQIVVQGESAVLKTSNSLISQSDATSAKVYPNDPYVGKVNYIGGSNWSGAGDKITWEIDIPEDGLYKVGFGYQQSYIMNGSSYRMLRIDGEIPFLEAAEIKFDYCNTWKFKTMDDSKGVPYLFYLTKGKHTFSLEVNLCELSKFSITLKNLIYDLGEIYRQMTMITGETPDANRDYNLFGQIPNFEKRLKTNTEIVNDLIKQMEAISGKGGSSSTANLKNMAAVMQRMLNYKSAAHTYKSSFYDNYSSISAWLYEMISMPLDIDSIYFASPQSEFEELGVGFFGRLMFGVKRFLASMASEYNSVSGDVDKEKSISLWVNWGRDQVQVLNYLAQSDFTQKTGIGVDIKMTNATLIQGILSGDGPDCYLHMSRTEPVNLAMRGALCDLTNFKGYNEVAKRFMPTAVIPYTYQGGIYALPDTQTFSVMFYRKDILNEIGVEVPQTWDDFIDAAAVIMRNNMQVGLPYTQITAMNQVNLGLGALNIFPTLLMQNNGKLYDDELSSTLLTNEESVASFKIWTNFYTKYSFPKTYDFYNRFRIGVMPLAIQSLSQYPTISAAASEIRGLWDITLIPGTLQENGTIDRTQAGAGTGCAILESSENKEEAWEFLKWWTSEETQYRYSQNVESILGITGRNMTANTIALSKLSWSGKHFDIISEQWKFVNEMPEAPGGYYIPRVVDQAFWNVIETGKSVEEMLLKWDTIADNEIAEKRSQYIH